MYEYRAKLTRIVDGDTLDFEVDLGFKIKHSIRVRLADIDTPEFFKPRNAAEKQHAVEAAQFIQCCIPVGSFVSIRTKKDRTGKYGRYLAQVFGEVGGVAFDLSAELRDNGFAKRDSYG